jgi:hypothetical protein
MRLLKTKPFGRWSRKERLPDEALVAAAAEIRRGRVDADLGGGLLKMRVARSGGGKRGGYRVFVASDARERCVFLYGFGKNERDNVDDKELVDLKRLAQWYLGLDRRVLEQALAAGILLEIEGGEAETA